MRIYAQARYDSAASINHIRCNLKDVTDSVRTEQELSHRTEKLTVANEQLRATNRKLAETQSPPGPIGEAGCAGNPRRRHGARDQQPTGLRHEQHHGPAARSCAGVLQLVEQAPEGTGGRTRGPGRSTSSAIDDFMNQIDLPFLSRKPAATGPFDRKRLASGGPDRREAARVRGLDRAELGEVDVNESIDQCTADARANRSAGWGSSDIGAEESVPLIQGAGSELNQVCLNLLSNSIDAIEQSGSDPWADHGRDPDRRQTTS